MKKGLMLLLCIVSFLGINTVSANTYISSNYYNNFEKYVNDYLEYEDNIDYMINYWEDNYAKDFPYYAIMDVNNNFILLHCSKTNIITYSSSGFRLYNEGRIDNQMIGIEYSISSDSYNYNITINPIYNVVDGSSNLLASNGLVYDGLDSEFDTYSFPSYESESLNISILEFEIKKGDFFPTISSLYDGSYVSNSLSKFEEINLNDYSYVILTLKDYSSRDTFTTTMYVKGQLCPTTVYNYGSEEKKDYISGWQSPNCGTYNEEYTRYMTYVRAEDITNHAVYYLTGYDSTKPNLVMVDTSIYNITYITSEDENNPTVSIDGKNYSTLPYSSLTDTAVLTEKNGINNTWTCAKYDTNCFLDSSGIDVDNLFSNPLETLETVWSAITSIFSLITEFISLLPPIMQAFLYLAFGVGIALGIIKIIL